MVTFSTDLSVKERVLANMKTTLETITVANGYHQDLLYVMRFEDNPHDHVSFPIVSLVGVREDFTQLEGAPPKYDVELYVTVNAVVSQGPVTVSETAINYLLRDIITALMQDNTRGGVARNTRVIGTDLTVLATEQPFVTASVTIAIKYQHDRGDPTQAR